MKNMDKHLDEGEWVDFERRLKKRQSEWVSIIGAFSASREEKVYISLKSIPIPRDRAPILLLPLRFRLTRGSLGCTLDAAYVDQALCVLNDIWVQAGIQFILVDGMEITSWDSTYSAEVLAQLKEQIWSLKRGTDGRMQNKPLRKQIFLDYLLRDYINGSLDAFDIWVFDFIGCGSQGACISRETYNIIVG